MRYYLKVSREGLMLAAYPLALPFFLLGLLRRFAIDAITGGDPLVP